MDSRHRSQGDNKHLALKKIDNLNIRLAQDFANNLIESGVHGALVALDDSFSWQSMALALQIPTQNSHARSILEREFNTLLEVGVVMLGDCVNSYVFYIYSWGPRGTLAMEILDLRRLLRGQRREMLCNTLRGKYEGDMMSYCYLSTTF